LLLICFCATGQPIGSQQKIVRAGSLDIHINNRSYSLIITAVAVCFLDRDQLCNYRVWLYSQICKTAARYFQQLGYLIWNATVKVIVTCGQLGFMLLSV
jgi:hypothetical protein